MPIRGTRLAHAQQGDTHKVPPFFRTARKDHQSASRGLLRGYATRSPPRRSLRVPGEVSPIRSRQGSPFAPLSCLLSTIFASLPLYRGFARRSRGHVRANEATSFWRAALSFAERKHSARSCVGQIFLHRIIVASTYFTVLRVSPSDLRHWSLRWGASLVRYAWKNLQLAASFFNKIIFYLLDNLSLVVRRNYFLSILKFRHSKLIVISFNRKLYERFVIIHESALSFFSLVV